MREEIVWEQYTSSFGKTTEDILNEYRSDLHNMTMRESLISDAMLCPAYLRAVSELGEFDQTNLDYFNYEKELLFGKFD